MTDVQVFRTFTRQFRTPRVYQSGHRKRVTGKLYKSGNKYLWRALNFSVWFYSFKRKCVQSIMAFY
ncbi:MAG: transposase [Promethearchaeota archaeon]